ncbi:glycoside hydrolase superfamily [Radiomyces spectabilis]|uniref:glycoside hydrolase superfamily n=1 Tax=Radiomyces spectabilis TaxID=64574 RepID=UPI00221FDBB3|nr:glycoside hydrolase superfamily [Radiomyces spectabilis]KAI8374624.1 glycoside hydrolase superfamily [Radiomyces spectabilis]
MHSLLYFILVFTAILICPGSSSSQQQYFDAMDSFVRVRDQGFILQGRPYVIAGANYWQGMHLAADDYHGGNRSRLLLELEQMAAMNINNLRIMASAEGPNDQPYRLRPALMPSPGKYNEAIFEGLDFLLDAMGRYNMAAVLTLNNFWHWSGGFGQYVAWVEKNQSIPYPDRPETWDAFTEYASRMWTDSNIREKAMDLFKDHIYQVQSRRNTVNGKLYREDPVIMAWQIANEPQLAPRWWFVELAQFIKQGAPYQLVSAGIESKFDETDFLNAHDSEFIDYCTCHCWVENWGEYNPSDPDDLGRAQSYVQEFLTTRAAWAKKVQKPLVLEEFGMARDAWRRPKDSQYKYDPETPTQHKDEYYEGIFDQITSMVNENPLSGWNFWAYGGLGRSTDEPNEYGMVWLGDPPHERRGWYSVYDKDSTVNVIRDANLRLKEAAWQDEGQNKGDEN